MVCGKEVDSSQLSYFLIKKVYYQMVKKFKC